jgi:hypothetical protein
MMKRVLLLGLFFIAGCASQKTSAIPPGPNYSSTPCSDNCGTDPGCNAGCTPLATPGTPQPMVIPGSR